MDMWRGEAEGQWTTDTEPQGRGNELQAVDRGEGQQYMNNNYQAIRTNHGHWNTERDSKQERRTMDQGQWTKDNEPKTGTTNHGQWSREKDNKARTMNWGRGTRCFTRTTNPIQQGSPRCTGSTRPDNSTSTSSRTHACSYLPSPSRQVGALPFFIHPRKEGPSELMFDGTRGGQKIRRADNECVLSSARSGIFLFPFLILFFLCVCEGEGRATTPLLIW